MTKPAPSNPRPCTIEDCDRPKFVHGWCTMHYARWRRNGDPNIVHRDWGWGKTASKVGYIGSHSRVIKAKGSASKQACAICGGAARHWAYDGLDVNEGVDRDGTFSCDPDHYFPACQPCHQRFDRRRVAVLCTPRECAA